MKARQSSDRAIQRYDRTELPHVVQRPSKSDRPAVEPISDSNELYYETPNQLPNELPNEKYYEAPNEFPNECPNQIPNNLPHSEPNDDLSHNASYGEEPLYMALNSDSQKATCGVSNYNAELHKTGIQAKSQQKVFLDKIICAKDKKAVLIDCEDKKDVVISSASSH
ncbi:hypothetical protein AC249_AIPGENE15857 [Exaiptasia diaphana]|nr:hypothetical protein AC249_AIPGENE15857 [Exaiptasia diaphana]